MLTRTAPPPADEKDRGRVILRDVPWDVYVSLRDRDANRHLRMAYYRGTLELMSPRYRHSDDVQAGALWFGRLQADGTYNSIARSECLPLLTPKRILEALALCHGVPESSWGRLLRDWIRGLSP